MLAKTPDTLRADFQHYYNLDLDQVGHGIRVTRAADLAAWLPDDAATWGRSTRPPNRNPTRQLLANIADNTGFLAWTKTKEAQRRGAHWKNRIPRPGMNEHRRNDDVQRLDPETVRRRLAMPRK